jgi:hypothetical protein
VTVEELSVRGFTRFERLACQNGIGLIARDRENLPRVAVEHRIPRERAIAAIAAPIAVAKPGQRRSRCEALRRRQRRCRIFGVHEVDEARRSELLQAPAEDVGPGCIELFEVAIFPPATHSRSMA